MVMTLALLAIVAVVVPAPGQELETWQVEPLFRTGGVDAPPCLAGPIEDVVIDSESNAIVSYPLRTEVHVIDGAGRCLGRIGRDGEGPGEYRSPGSLGIRNDTIWLEDSGLGRLTLYSADGEFLDAISFGVVLPGTLHSPVAPEAYLADATVYGEATASAQLVADGRISERPSLRISREGELIDTLFVSSVDRFMTRIDGLFGTGSVTYRIEPFSDADLATVDPGGRWLAKTELDGAEREERRFRVTKIEPSGDTLYSRSYSYEGQPLGEAEIRDGLEKTVSRFAQMAEAYPNLSLREERIREKIRDAIYIPPVLPPIDALVGGQDGTLWLRREASDPQRWEVLNEAGERVAEVYLPSGFRLLAATEESLWGEERGELGENYLVRYRIER